MLSIKIDKCGRMPTACAVYHAIAGAIMVILLGGVSSGEGGGQSYDSVIDGINSENSEIRLSALVAAEAVVKEARNIDRLHRIRMREALLGVVRSVNVLPKTPEEYSGDKTKELNYNMVVQAMGVFIIGRLENIDEMTLLVKQKESPLLWQAYERLMNDMETTVVLCIRGLEWREKIKITKTVMAMKERRIKVAMIYSFSNMMREVGVSEERDRGAVDMWQEIYLNEDDDQVRGGILDAVAALGRNQYAMEFLRKQVTNRDIHEKLRERAKTLLEKINE